MIVNRINYKKEIKMKKKNNKIWLIQKELDKNQNIQKVKKNLMLIYLMLIK